ncbi:NAD-binding protein [Phellopilus nigrolimitatus]|nr:NAD-binding protein [Phellopilus nigrolimitatus]
MSMIRNRACKELFVFCGVLSRAIVFTSNGPPAKSIQVLSFPEIPPPPPKTLNIRYLLSPINPSDINVIEGTYPAKPIARSNLTENGPGSSEQPCFIVGNEGLAVVSEVGECVRGYKKGDQVVMVKPQAGTWSSNANIQEDDVIRIPDVGGQQISEVQGATMTVNPPTAYNMLKEFVDLKPGDWIVQNGANSAVGQAVIQIAAHRGLKTINFVRDRPDFSTVEKQLLDLGATHVLPLESLSDNSARARVKGYTNGAPIRLALNCVSGPTTASLVRLLGTDAHLVSYGAMSKQPITLPTSAFIFKSLTAHGFMQGRWYKENGREGREKLMRELTTLMASGKLKEPLHSIFTVPISLSDEEATTKVREVIDQMTSGEGMVGKKMLIKFQGT